ncbi:hypothetical protein FRC02_007402 [Tulasnella sp. 418]|nr:hypothetical protein FRC02_007402 [Tulasnella sp. 418]
MSTKPLPPPPPASSCTHTHTSPAFTPEAIGHLRKLLTQTVEGERLDTQWVNHLERALLDLAEASNKAQWLFGLRNKRRHHWPYSPIRNLEDNKNSSIDKSNDESNDQEKNTPVMTDHDLTRQALVYLDTLISSNHTCDYEYSRLLITLAPPSSAIPFPDLGIDFDLRPHRETCTFQPGVFNLPFFTPSELAPRRGNGGTILCGLQDCKAEISIDGILQDSAPPKVKVVGGNFILKGVYSVDDHLSLAKVLRIGIYALLSIQLELNLHRDCHVPLIYPPPPPAILKKPRPRSPSPTKPSSPPPDELETPRNKSFGGGATTSIWNFIAKKTSGIMRPLHIGPTSTHQPAPILPHFPATESLGVRVMADGSKPTPPTPTPLTAHFPGSVGSHHGRTSLDIVRTFSHHLRLTTSDDLVHKHPRPNQAKEDATLMMFSSAVAKITNDQAVLSTSPGIKFPPPSLIRRLAEREASSSTKSKFRLTGDEKAGLTSILGWHDPSEHKNGNGEVPNTGIVIDTGMFIKHQRLTVLYAEHVPAADEPAVKDLLAGNANGSVKSKEKGKEKEGSGGTSEVSGTDSTIRTEESVSGDVVPARSATPPHPKLASSTSSSSSFHIQQQQAIPPSQLPPLPPPTKPTKPCITAHWRTYSYYSQNQLPSSASITPDMSLGKFVETTIGSSVLYLATPKKDEETDEKDEDDDGEDVEVILPACNRPGCGKKRLEHGFNWIHAGVKVTARIEEVDHFPEEEEQADSEDEEIWMWNGCKVCGEKSEKRGMSDGSYLFSFAKYLELLIYSPAMCNVEHNICSHTTSPLARPPNRPKRSASSAKSKKSIPPPISTIPFGTAQSFLLSALPQERFNILRYFYLKSRHSRTQPKGYALVFEVAAVESDIFEVRVPRIQIIKSVVEVKKSDTEARKVRFGTVMGKEPEDGVIDLNDGTRIEDEDEEKKELRGEIEVWWEGIKERLEKLETYISSVSDSRESETTLRRNDPRTKRLPLMPNDDEEDTPAASDEKAKQGEEDENGSSPSTPKATASESGPPPTSSSTTSLPSQTAQAASSRPTSPFPGFPSLPFTLPRPSSPAPQPPPKDIHNKLEVLGSLRELKTSFIQSEQQMYSSLSTTDTQELNDVRRTWVAGARAAKRKLKVWEEKFVGKGWNIVEGVESGELELDEPDWWDKGSYVLPKNRVVIREKDWGSVIAFTLSSPEYRRELENMATGRKFSGAGASLASARSNASKTTAITVPSTPSSISLAISHTGSPSNPSKLSSSTKSVPSTPAQVDDDPFSSPWTLTGYEDIEGMETEQYSAVVTRKEHPKDVAADGTRKP